MNRNLSKSYRQEIASRSSWHYLKGWLIRWWTNLGYALARNMARRKGALIGESSVLPWSLARKANGNLVVGNHVSIQSKELDLRNPVHIGNYTIIGDETVILTTSHDIDTSTFERKDFGIVIEDYVWIPGKALILPSCRHIGQGAVIGAGSVVAHDVDSMSVVGGNPAKEIKKRKSLHTDLVVESLLGGDFDAYREARKL